MTKSRSKSRSMKKPLSRSLRIYQKVAILFMIGSFVLLLIVLYLSISKATIRITPSEKVVSTTISLEVVEEATLDQVKGIVIEESFEKAETFTLPGEGTTPVEKNAGGMVTIINESGTDQPLVATTRLLSEGDILFRIDDGVTVPAGGSVAVMAHADLSGAQGDIAATTFTIPGLTASRQQEVYAMSSDAMTGGVAYLRLLEESDLDEAIAELESQILEEAKEILRDGVDEELRGEVYFTELIEKVSDTEPGEEVGSFTASVSVSVTAVYYDEEAVLEAAEAQLALLISEGYELTEINQDGLQVDVTQVDVESGTATLSVYLDGIAAISAISPILEKDRLLGRSPIEVITILESSDSIESVTVSFTPFWLKRVPSLKDHIKIVVVEE